MKRSQSESSQAEELPMSKSYKRAEGTTGFFGNLYESKLIALILLRLKKNEYEFDLGTNVEGINGMDDICLRYRRPGEKKFKYVFIQAKHRENPENQKITSELLHEKNRKKDKNYSVHRYFNSYLKIRKRFETSSDYFFDGKFDESDIELILYTNAKMDCVSEVQISCDELVITKDEKLYLADFTKLVKFENNGVTETQVNIVDELWNNADAELRGNKEDDLPADFLKKFKIYYIQANESEVGDMICEAIDSNPANSQLIFLVYHDLVQNYWKTTGEMKYLTNQNSDYLDKAKETIADTCAFSKWISSQNLNDIVARKIMSAQNMKSIENVLFMSAVKQKNHNEMKRLHNHGANVNFFNPAAANGNCTPLHVAVAVQDPDAAELLLFWGAKSYRRNFEGVSPRDMVEQINDPEIAEQFRQCFNLQNTNTTVHISNCTYKRQLGTGLISGILYECKMLALILYRLKKGGYQFQLGCNVHGMRYLNDLCFRCRLSSETDYKYYFINIKHSGNPQKHIKFKNLFENDTVRIYNILNLHYLFADYLTLRERFKTGKDDFFVGDFEKLDINAIFYTSASSDFDSEHQISSDALLKSNESGKVLMVEANYENALKLSENIPTRYSRLTNELSAETLLYLASDFLKRFKIYCHQAKENELSKLFCDEIGGGFDNKQTTSVIYFDLVQKYWQEQNNVSFLTENCEFFQEAEEATTDSLLIRLLTNIHDL